MSKPLFIISAPVDTYSGYGARSRDIVDAIIATDRYDVKLLSQRWGNTRFGYLADHGRTDMIKLIIPHVVKKPDYWMQITVPNEFTPAGKYNIGVTAGMENTLVAPQWIEGVNRMNVVWTSSKHSKVVFESTAYDTEDKQTKKKGVLKCTTPIEVMFEGVDTTKYFPVSGDKIDLSDIPEQFCYLLVGHWMQGDFGEDRKNVGYTIKTFLETFKNKSKQPALILKTSLVNTSILDRDRLLKRIDDIRKTVKGKLPNIYLLHGELSDENINYLYNHSKVKVMVSHTKGEGFGRPLLEFTTTGKPIIASGWSGQVDFLDKDKSILIGGRLDPVHDSAVVKDMILKEAKWFRPNDDEVGKAYKETFKHYKKYLVPAKQQRARTKKEFTLDHMFSLVDSRLKDLLPEFPQEVELKLPELELPKL